MMDELEIWMPDPLVDISTTTSEEVVQSDDLRRWAYALFVLIFLTLHNPSEMGVQNTVIFKKLAVFCVRNTVNGRDQYCYINNRNSLSTFDY